MINSKNKIVYILLLFIALVVSFFVYRHFSLISELKKFESQQIKAREDDLISFSFSPEEVSVVKGEDFTLDILIDPKKHDVSNADLVFSYNKEKMRLNNVAQSDKFPQVLSSFISTEDGKAVFSASTGFDSTLNSKAKYATLHFSAIEKAENISILIDKEKSGIYADDNPGVNILELSSPALISITEKNK